MTAPARTATDRVASAILALSRHASITQIRKAVDRALFPEEPATPGALVVIFNNDEDSALMRESVTVFQRIDDAGSKRWWNDDDMEYSSWDDLVALAMRSGIHMRVFVPASESVDALGTLPLPLTDLATEN